MIALYAIIVGLIAMSTGGPASSSQVESSEDVVVFCSPKVSPALARGYASFWLIYEVQLDEVGRPTSINLLRAQQGVEAADSCLEQWLLPSFAADEAVKVAFYWQHARGWSYVQLSSQSRRLKIQIPERLNPYGKCKADTE